MLKLSFKEYVTMMNESDSLKNCDFIKDPKLKAKCKKLHKHSKGGVVMYGSLGGGASTAGAPASGGCA